MQFLKYKYLLKANSKGVFSKIYCWCGKILRHQNDKRHVNQ